MKRYIKKSKNTVLSYLLNRVLATMLVNTKTMLVNTKSHALVFVGVLFFGLFSSCSITVEKQPFPQLKSDGLWAINTLANFSEVPNAGQRVTAILKTHLNSKGFYQLKQYQPKSESITTLISSNIEKNKQEALEWARKNRVSYLITGSVEEWRYKYGVDGEPTVGVSLQIVDVETANTLWSASASRTGRSYQNLSGVTSSILKSMTNEFKK